MFGAEGRFFGGQQGGCYESRHEMVVGDQEGARLGISWREGQDWLVQKESLIRAG